MVVSQSGSPCCVSWKEGLHLAKCAGLWVVIVGGAMVGLDEGLGILGWW